MLPRPGENAAGKPPVTFQERIAQDRQRQDGPAIP
jgi:hypothetical protein